MSFRRTDHQQTNAGGRTCHDWSTALKETASPEALATRPTIRNRAPTWSVWRGLRLQTRETNPCHETPRGTAAILANDSRNKGDAVPFLFLAYLVYLGYKAKRLRWQHFGWLAIGSIPATLLKHYSVQQARLEQGRPVDGLFDPANIIVSAAANFLVWAVVYLLAHAIGRWRRSKRTTPRHPDFNPDGSLKDHHE